MKDICILGNDGKYYKEEDLKLVPRLDDPKNTLSCNGCIFIEKTKNPNSSVRVGCWNFNCTTNRIYIPKESK